MAETQPKLDKWMIGYIPNTIIKCSVPREEMIELAITGYAMFYKTFGVKLYFTQSLIIAAMISDKPEHRLVIAITPTRYGKSFIVGGGGQILAGLKHQEVNIGGATKDKSEIIMTKVIDHLQTASDEITDNLLNSADKIENLRAQVSKDGLSWRTGGRINLFSFNENLKNTAVKGQGVIGIGGDTMIIDESPLVSDENYRVGRRFLIESAHTKMVELGNPVLLNHFKDSYDDPNTFVIHINDQTAIEEGRMRQEDFDLLKFPVHSAEYRHYIKCEFPKGQASNAFFGSLPLIGNIDKKGDYFIGIDSAYKGADDIVLTLGKIVGGKIYTVAQQSLKPEVWEDVTTIRDIVQKIGMTWARFDVKMACIDIGFGIHIYEAFRAKFPDLEIIPINFGSSPTKERIESDYAATWAANMRAELHLDAKDLCESEQLYVSDEIAEDIHAEMKAVKKIQRGKKIQVAPKADLKIELGGRSPDNMDSMLLMIHAVIIYMIRQKSLATIYS